MVRQSIEFYLRGDLQKAFNSIKNVPEDIRNPRLFAYRAALLLAVGRVAVKRPTTFELAINLKAAKVLGLTIPSTLLASSQVPSLAWCPVTVTAKRRHGGGRPISCLSFG